MAGHAFSSDGPISYPVAPTVIRPVLAHLTDDDGNTTGWGFTSGGICIVISESDREEIFSQFYTPPDIGGVINGG